MSETEPVDDEESGVDADEIDAVVRDAMSDTQKMSVDEIAAAVLNLEQSEAQKSEKSEKSASGEKVAASPAAADDVKPAP
jgi:hypothetical protein